ncbi:cellulose synthase family protein [Methylacidimicrobium sp. B4]|uniref:cellulose synthase family protein n=1 Tax=Methylacidimicrobium sp. B4 TaxID=2796139 RepID=UPI001A8E48B2|nr:cellulose synthase family protein [Methylacidimicrobium sp. B4]QSR84915.1 glycosyltransferase family 2 protein [Methylacidimicrobium sp. B4]
MIWVILLVLALALAPHAAHRLSLLIRLHRLRDQPSPCSASEESPKVTIQLPIYNERFVVERLLRSVAALDYPRDRLEIQVLDDSTDATSLEVRRIVEELLRSGVSIEHIRRPTRAGFKAGALQHGLERARGELIAILDADFVPPADFLRKAVPYFSDPRVGMVQARWGFLNREENLLTRCEALFLDGHFLLEQAVRSKGGLFFNFNGTAGLWRKSCIEDAGGWDGETLTEDLDLSYRAQFRGWRFVYAPEIVVPSELPAPITAFRTQQHRWAKGAIQTARRHLPALFRGAFPWRHKVEGGFHLLAHTIHPLVAALALLNLAVLLAPCPASTLQPVVSCFFTGLSVSFLLYLLAVQRLHKGKIDRSGWLLLPVSLALSLGMSFANTRSVIEGALNVPSSFVRTPKRGDAGGRSLGLLYLARQGWGLPLLETSVAAAFLWALVVAIRQGWWFALPGCLLHLFGFGFVGVGTLTAIAKERRQSAAVALA